MNQKNKKIKSYAFIALLGLTLSSGTLKAAPIIEYTPILPFTVVYTSVNTVKETTPFWLGSDSASDTGVGDVVIDTRVDNLDAIVAAYLRSGASTGWDETTFLSITATNSLTFNSDPNRNRINIGGNIKGKRLANGSVVVTATLAIKDLPITVYDKAGFVDMVSRSFNPTVPQVLYKNGLGNAVLQAQFIVANDRAPLDLNQAYATGNLISLSMTLTGEAMASDGSRVHIHYQSKPNSTFNGKFLDGRVNIESIGN